MSLAQRVRDYRYSKGWGPDELASRAEISRTALYQIESGKTGLPRAGTLRRIAMALDVPMEDLLGHEGQPEPSPPIADPAFDANPRRARTNGGWDLADGGPLTLPAGNNYGGLSAAMVGEPRFVVEATPKSKPNFQESVLLREGELITKLHDLLHSHLGEGVAHIVDELHSLLPRNRGLG